MNHLLGFFFTGYVFVDESFFITLKFHQFSYLIINHLIYYKPVVLVNFFLEENV